MNTILEATSSVGPLTEPVTHTIRIADHTGYDNDCETRGVEYTVTIQEIAPGLVVVPVFACPNCRERLSAELVAG